MADHEPKKTQGQLKMERYIEDLIRNKIFLRKLKRLRKYLDFPDGNYDTWTEEQKKRHDYINDELGSIIKAYDNLRKRTNKLMADRYWKVKCKISELYNLDDGQIGYIETLFNPKYKDVVGVSKYMADLDMCRAWDFNDEELHPFNKGEEIIYLNRRRQLFLNAYPVGIFIHPKASKRDVLDFIEKRWSWIENNFLRGYADKKLKHGKRKHGQQLLDFLWQNRFLPAMKLKEKLEETFPENGLVYYEISKILQLEKARRFGNLT